MNKGSRANLTRELDHAAKELIRGAFVMALLSIGVISCLLVIALV